MGVIECHLGLEPVVRSPDRLAGEGIGIGVTQVFTGLHTVHITVLQPGAEGDPRFQFIRQRDVDGDKGVAEVIGTITGTKGTAEFISRFNGRQDNGAADRVLAEQRPLRAA